MPDSNSTPEDAHPQTLPPQPDPAFQTLGPDGFATLPSHAPNATPIATPRSIPADIPEPDSPEPDVLESNSQILPPDSGEHPTISTFPPVVSSPPTYKVSAAAPISANTPKQTPNQGLGRATTTTTTTTSPITSPITSPLKSSPASSDTSPLHDGRKPQGHAESGFDTIASQFKSELLPDDTAAPSQIAGDFATVAPSQASLESLNDATSGHDPSNPTGFSSFGPMVSAKGLSREPLRYRILKEHAKGGLGKVFVAEDLELDREVAFKEIQRKYASDRETQLRFLREAKITGGLEHPGIVPIYGLGTYPDGRPYYAMRFIRGRSLQQAIEAYHRLRRTSQDQAAVQIELRQLLRRFIDVCDALEYAHAQGVIHRDLKPGNIMLGEYGETLVVDWGLAKSYVEPEPEFEQSTLGLTPRTRLSTISGDASLQTMAGTIVGTPQFMSPEQAQGKEGETGPASDIYSLGATLYGVLTGSGAFSAKTVDQLVVQVIAGDFPPPNKVQPGIPNALNAICLKAMARLPHQRYASAKALAADIEHWLADEPVEAYQETPRELFNRWIRKHQARAQAIGVAIIAIAAVSIVAAVLIDQSRRAETRALENLKIANDAEIRSKQEALRRSRQTREAVDTLLSGMSDALETYPGMQDARRRLLERAASDYAKLAEDSSEDPELKAEAARNLVRLGDVRLKLNSVNQALAEYSQAADTFTKLAATYPDVPEHRFELAQTHIQQGVALAGQGQHVEAEQQFQNAVNLLTPLTEKSPEDSNYHDGLATALIGIGRARNAAGDAKSAEQFLTRGLQTFDQLRAKFPRSERIASAQTQALSAMGRFLLDRGRAGDAIRLFEQSLKIHDESLASSDEHPESYANRANVRINLAEAQRSQGQWQNVARNYESAVDDYQELVRAQPDVPQFRENLAVARTNWGQALRRLGNNPAAVPVLEKSLENFNELGASYPLPRYVENAANTRVSLAQVLSELGKQDDAAASIELALEDYRELLDLDPNVSTYQEASAIAVSNQARILARKGDFAGALAKFEAATEVLKQIADREPETPRYRDNLAWTWTHLGNVALAANQPDQAKRAFGAAIEARQTLQAAFPKSPQYQDSLAWLLATCPIEELQNIPRGLKLALDATATVPESPQFQLTLGAAQWMIQQPAAALETLATARKLTGQDDGLTLCLMALCEADLNRQDNAAKHLTTIQTWRSERKPADEELARWEKLVDEAVK